MEPVSAGARFPESSTGWTHWQITSSFRWQISTGHFCLIPTNPRPFRIARDQQRGHLRWPSTWHMAHAHTHTPSCDQQSIVTVLPPHVLVYLGMYTAVYTVYINIHHIDRIFHEINHPALGVPPFLETPKSRIITSDQPKMKIFRSVSEEKLGHVHLFAADFG